MSASTALLPSDSPRSRRALLAGALGGLAALAATALGRPAAAQAAAGDNLKLGQANTSGTSQTTLTNGGTGAAFTLKSTNTSINSTGIFGWSSSTGAGATRGVYGRADGPNSIAVHGRQSGPIGGGAAVWAEGVVNTALVATNTSPTKPAILATATSGLGGFDGGVAVRGLSGGATVATLHPSDQYWDAAGEFAGNYGVIGASNHAAAGAGVVGLGGFVGVYGRADHATGFGIQGVNQLGTGVKGESIDGYGVHGASDNDHGVLGESVDATGVRGISTNGAGVVGISTEYDGVTAVSSTGYGIFASSSSNYAGYFTNGVYFDDYLDVREMPAPPAPPADRGRLFTRQNAGGKTELCVIFGGEGAAHILATQG